MTLWVELGQVSHIWKEYFKELCNEKQENVQLDFQEKTKEEIKCVMLKAAGRKASGPGNIAVEFWKGDIEQAT